MDTEQWTFSKQFYSRFQTVKADLEERLRAAKESSEASTATHTELLDQLAVDISKLVKDLSDATGHLPSHDQRGYEQQVKALEKTIEELRATVAPKQKFAFKRRTGVGTAPAAKVTDNSVPESKVDAAAAGSQGSTTTNWTITGRSHEYITHESAPTSGSDLTIADLESCIVNLTGCASSVGVSEGGGEAMVPLDISAIHMRNLRNCVLVLPIVKGSVLTHDLSQCVMAIGCHQFRMHTSSDVDVYISISSNPIIESCRNARFAAYPQALANDSHPTDGHLQVKDFTHVKASPSPNWSLIGEDVRVLDWPLTPVTGAALRRVVCELCTSK